jgi:hypothetical protein
MAAVNRDGRVKACEGAVSLAASKKQRQADGDRFTRTQFVQHLERGQARYRTFSQFLAGAGHDADLPLGKTARNDDYSFITIHDCSSCCACDCITAR